MSQIAGQAMTRLRRLLHLTRRMDEHPAGQAAIGAGIVLHRLLTVVLGLAVLLGVGAGALAWRLSRGPIELPWLTRRIEAAANDGNGPTQLHIGRAALAWEGFHRGIDAPLDIRLTDVTVADPGKPPLAAIPSAAVSLSPGNLLIGRIVPRSIEIDRPALTMLRAADGGIRLAIGSLNQATDSAAPTAASGEGADARAIGDLLTELGRPPKTERAAPTGARFAQLRRVRISDGTLTVIDRQLGATWHCPRVEIDLRRQSRGGVEGDADVTLALGDQTARLTATAALAASGAATHLTARLSPVAPAALSRAAPLLAPLSALEAPVSAELTVQLGPRFAPQDARLTVTIAAGQAEINAAAVPIAGGAAVLEATPAGLALRSFRLALHGRAGAVPTVLHANGMAMHGADGRLAARLEIDLDQLAFADLATLWPAGVGDGGRAWVTQNITAGTARNAHVQLTLAANADLSGVALTGATGTLEGSDLTVWWLRPVPPLDHGQARLRILDPDSLAVDVLSGQQRRDALNGARAGAGVAVTGGEVHITGLTHHDQDADIKADLAGPVPDALALLREPRLRLLDKHPLPLTDPAGSLTGTLHLALPLKNSVTMDGIAIDATGHLADVHLGAIVAGRDLDDGAFDLAVSGDGMTANGTAALGGIPAKLDIAMDFRAGPPAQVLQKITAAATPDARQLAAAGLDGGGIIAGGSADVQATLSEQRDGHGQVAVTADLTPAALAVTEIAWSKPAGAVASAAADVRLLHDRLLAVDAIRLSGDGIDVRGTTEFSDGRASLLRLDAAVLGQTRAQGTVQFPASPGAGPIRVAVHGASIDLSARLSRNKASAVRRAPDAVAPAKPGPPWTVDARFDRAIMANREVLTAVTGHVEDDGVLTRALRLDATTNARTPISLRIEPAPGGRRLTASTADAGTLLRALDIMKEMEGGKLSVNAQFQRPRRRSPFVGQRRDHRLPHPQRAGLGQAAAGDDAVRAGERGERAGPRLLAAGGAVHAGGRPAHIGRCACLQFGARTDREGQHRPRRRPRRRQRHHRAGVFLQLPARPHPADRQAVQPGEGRRPIRRQLHGARAAARPAGRGQSAVGADAGGAARAVRQRMTFHLTSFPAAASLRASGGHCA